MFICFFFKKILKIRSGAKFFCGLTFDFLSSLFFVRRESNSTIEQEKCKAYEKLDCLLVSKRIDAPS